MPDGKWKAVHEKIMAEYQTVVEVIDRQRGVR